MYRSYANVVRTVRLTPLNAVNLHNKKLNALHLNGTCTDVVRTRPRKDQRQRSLERKIASPHLSETC